MPWTITEAALTSVQAKLSRQGLDICHAFRMPMLQLSQLLPLPETTLPQSQSQMGAGLLLGNTKQFWPAFLEYGRMHPGWMHATKHPVDSYTEAAVMEALRDFSAGVEEAQVFFGHCRYDFNATPSPTLKGPQPQRFRFPPLQRIAQESGFAMLRPSTYLCIHPTYGPWFALRAIVYLGSVPPTFSSSSVLSLAGPPPSVSLPDEEEHRLKERVQHLLSTSTKPSVQDWIQVRRQLAHLVPGADQWEYSPNQLLYHYTHDRQYLQLEVDKS